MSVCTSLLHEPQEPVHLRHCQGLALPFPPALSPPAAVAGSIMLTQWSALGTQMRTGLSEDVGKKKVRPPEQPKALLVERLAAGSARVRIVFGSRRACLLTPTLQECIEQLVLRACLILAFSLFLREDDVFQHSSTQAHSRQGTSLASQPPEDGQ